MSVDIAELGLEVRSDGVIMATQRLKDMGKAANQAETAAQRLERQAKRTGAAAMKMGKNMTMYVTAPLALLGAASIKAFANFDDAMNASLAIMGDVSEAMRKEMRMEARKMGKETAFSATQAAESFYFLASAGLSAEASVAALTKVAAFAQAGNFDMARATDILTDAQSALGRVMKDPIENMEQMVVVSDVLVNAATKANASVEQFGIALTNKAGIAIKDLNIDLTTGVAVLAAWADQGIKAEEAGEKFNIVTRDLQTAIRKNADVFDDYNIKVFDSQGAFRNMADIIEDLENALGPMSVQQRGATLSLLGFQDRSVIAIRSLIGLSDKIRKYEKDLEATGTTQEVAAKQMESFAKKLGLVKSEIADFGIEIGASLAPAMLKMAETVKEWVKSFRDLDVGTQAMILKVALFVGAVGPLLIIMGALLKSIGFLIPLLYSMQVAIITRVVPAFVAWAAALGGTFGVVALIQILTVAIGLLVFQIVKMVREAEELAGAFDVATSSVERYAKAIKNAREASDLADEIDEINAAAIRLEQEMIDIDEQLSVFANSGDKFSNPVFLGLIEEKEHVEQAMIELGEQFHLLRERQRELAAGTDDVSERLKANASIMHEFGEAMKFLDALIAEEEGITKLAEEEAEALQALRDELDPLAAEAREVAKAQALLDKALKAGVKNGGISSKMYERLTRLLRQSTTAFQEAAEAALRLKSVDFMTQNELDKSMAYVESLELMAEQVEALEDSLFPAVAELERLAEAQELLNKAWDAGVFEGREQDYYDLSEAVQDATSSVELANDAFMMIGSSAMASLKEVQGMLHEDSAAAESVRTAMLALNIAMGIYAVIKQLAGGDVYSAIPRALGVAAMVASMGVQTSAAGSSASSRSLQESQGTGSILGDAEAKSESILRASEITADATSELVGINRGMLHALQNLQAGLGGASVQLARGAGDVDFGELPTGLDFNKFIKGLPFLGNFFGSILNKLFGGKSKLLDTGIRIVGGFLDDLTTDVMVQAFQIIKSKKSIFHSSKIKENFETLGDEVSIQFALVFASIRDTVMEGALALGIPLDVIEDRIAAFQLATIDISLMGLSADEAQEELLAVFSEIFDDLAADVVPFIGQFQKVGEGLGETLVRVATSVQVFQEVAEALGWSLEGTPEEIAMMSVALVELTGGVENFLSLFSSFFDKFATDAQKLEFITGQLEGAFSQMGLSMPATRQGFFDLVMSMDATTEAGRANIATLLGISGAADEYYSLMEDGTNDMLSQAQDLANEVAAFLGLDYGPLRQLTDSFISAMKAAKSLNATQKEYALITRKFDLELKRMAASLKVSILSMVETLFGTGLFGGGNPVVGGLEETRQVANSVFEEWIRALESIFDYTQSLLIDETFSTLTPAERLSEAQLQFNETLAKAQAGDLDAAAALPEAARALLENARFMYASGQQYTDIFDAVLAGLDTVDIPGSIPPFLEETVGGGLGEDELTPGEIAIAALEKYLMAVDLATALRDLSQVLGTSVIDLALELGVPLRELAEILNVQLDPMNDTTAMAIGDMAALLGANVFELMEALGVNIMELAAATGISVDEMTQALALQLGEFATMLGANVFELAETMGISIAELATQFGVDVANFSAEQFAGLIAFSEALGVSMIELGTSLGIQLGSIRDSTSLISQGFDDAVADLPPEQAAELQPYLDAIRDATDTTESEIAIRALGDYITGLPPEIAAPLIPFLEAMGWEKIAPELAAILEIAANTGGILGWQSSILHAIKAIDLPDINIEINIGTVDATNSTGGGGNGKDIEPIPYDPLDSFASGGYVDRTGLYQLHAGEFVVDKNRDTITPSGDGNLSSRELKEIRNVLGDIRDQNRRYQEENLRVSGEMESSLKQQTEQRRRIANG